MASKSVICNLNLNGNQIENAVIQVLATAPSTPTAGWIYYDSVKHSIGYYNGSAWVYVDAGNVYAIDDWDETVHTDIYQIYQDSATSTSGNDTLTTFTFRALKAGTNISLSKTAVESPNDDPDLGKEFITVTVSPSTATDLGGSSSSDSLVPSQAAVKAYVDAEILKVNTDITGAMHFIGTWDGTKTIAQNLAATGQAITKLRKGDYWVVDTACAHASIPSGGIESATGDGGLEVGDMVIAISDISDTSQTAPTASDFKVIDNSESADLLRDGDVNWSGTLDGTSTTTIPSEKVVADAIAEVTDNQVNQYQVLVDTAVSTKSVAATVHKCGKYPEVKVYQYNATATSWEEVVAKVEINASGNVTVTWNTAINIDSVSGEATDPIRIVIMGSASTTLDS